jgi:FHA domain
VRFGARQAGLWVLIAGTMVGVGNAMATGASGIDTGVEVAAQVFAWVDGHARAILATAYDRAPVLVLVLAVLLIIPMAALAALLAHALHVSWTGRRSTAGAGTGWGQAPMARSPVPTFQPTISAKQPGDTPWPATAWLAIDGFPQAPLPKIQGLVRIGRHEDNDICLPQSSVHRHHAIIHRTPEAEYIIMDLSGPSGNGVVVNGERKPEARLKSGDSIELGTVTLRFQSVPL